MPIQWPKKFIGTSGTHRIGEHVQYVMINVPEPAPDPTLPPGTVAPVAVEIYLPPVSVIAAPLTIVNKGSGLITLRPVGGTIGGASLHKMVNAIWGGGSEGRLVLAPSVSESGSLNGNWSILSGNVAHRVQALAASENVEADTTTKMALSVAFDAVDAMVGLGWTPKETDVYEAVASVRAAALSDGTVVYATLSKDDVSNRDLQEGQSFTSMGMPISSFNYHTQRVFESSTEYFFRVRHNDGAGTKAISIPFFQILRRV